MFIDSSNMLAEVDPWEVVAIASGFIKIDRVVMTWSRLRSDIEFGAANVMN